ncbi:MAG: alr [Gammaproteobacteria bacterium]|jgi:alanine racemase|nr:alr [Gammaproteobacteria bacterium]
MSRPTKIVIHLDALQHNMQQIKKRAPHSSILAMVKSNGYGHGIERVALALSNADAFGVACSEEGLLLRKAGVRHPIILIEGLFTSDELKLAEIENFTPVIHHESQVDMLEKNSCGGNPLSVWLKINTGMNRLGFKPAHVKKIVQRLMACPNVKKPLCFMTHFATADSSDLSQTQQQIDLFDKTIAGFEGLQSLCNSAGIITYPSAQRNWVRPGLMLYGASPFPGHHGIEYGLRPAMSLQSKLIAIHTLTKDECVGYGSTWKSPEEMRIGVVAMGYGDGYPQFAKNGTPILVNHSLCPLVGRVSMDMLTVDLRTQPHAKVGDPVTLWGNGLPVEAVAEGNHSSAYELLTRITQRVRVEVS